VNQARTMHLAWFTGFQERRTRNIAFADCVVKWNEARLRFDNAATRSTSDFDRGENRASAIMY